MWEIETEKQISVYVNKSVVSVSSNSARRRGTETETEKYGTFSVLHSFFFIIFFFEKIWSSYACVSFEYQSDLLKKSQNLVEYKKRIKNWEREGERVKNGNGTLARSEKWERVI